MLPRMLITQTVLWAASEVVSIGCTGTVPPMADSSKSPDDAQFIDVEDAFDAATNTPTDSIDADFSTVDVVVSLESIAVKHDDLRTTLASWTNEPARIHNGDWVGDYGDAPMYGPSYDLRQWAATGIDFHLQRALMSLEHNQQLVKAATSDLSVLMSQTESVAMALLSLLEAGLILPTDEYHVAADALLDVVDALSVGYGDYLAIDVGAFAANTYGPTSLTSMIAIMHLQHAMAYPEHDLQHSLRRGTQVLDKIHELTWDTTSSTYRISPNNEKLDLYPSATTMLAMGRAYELTGESKWSTRISNTYVGIQALKAQTGDHYHSPYSAEYMGATDDDYSTLSSQNYLMLALLLGGFATQNTELWLDIDRILGFLKSHLLIDGYLVHHWMNGRPASPFDKEYLCTGCNLQTLYLFTLLNDYHNAGRRSPW
ncbi:MAG: hypothetical protein HUU55_16225 [Myxococcales bacterium]|nr:hypothetical protein [Myxococcales bacterium]